MRPALARISTMLLLTGLTVGAPSHAESEPIESEPVEACCRLSAASDGWQTNYPGLVVTGVVFSAVSLVNFGVVGGFSGQQPNEVFYAALVSGAIHYPIGVSLLTAGLIMDEADQGATAVEPEPLVSVSPAGISLQWRF